MTVKELKTILDKFKDNQEVIFYDLENYVLEHREIETVLDADGRCEITLQSTEVKA
jgi:hypothetical protein